MAARSNPVGMLVLVGSLILIVETAVGLLALILRRNKSAEEQRRLRGIFAGISIWVLIVGIGLGMLALLN